MTMRRVFMLLLCSYTLCVSAQTLVPGAYEAVIQPLTSERIDAPTAEKLDLTTAKPCTTAYREALDNSAATMKTNLPPERITQCESARSFLMNECNASDELVKIKAALIDTCFVAVPKPQKPPKRTLGGNSGTSGKPSLSGKPSSGESMSVQQIAPDSQMSFNMDSIPPSGGTTTGAALQTAGGVALSFEQKLIFGLTALAVSGVREALLEEALGDFGTALCTNKIEESPVYFTSVCRLIAPDAKAELKTLSPKQLGRAFQAALQEDLERAVPLLIARAAERGGLAEGALTPVSSALIDLLRGRAQGRALAQRILLSTSCPTRDASACATLQLITAAAASVFQPGCTTVDTCRPLFEQTIRDAARNRLESWAAANNISRECLDAVPSDPADGWKCGSDDILAKLRTDPARPRIEFWLGEISKPTVRQTIIETLHGARPATPSIHGYLTLIEKGLIALTTSQAITAEEAASVRSAIARVDPRIFRNAELAILVYRTAQGIRNHENPISLVGTAASSAPCDTETPTDLQCGFRLFGVAMESIVHTNEKQQARFNNLDNREERRKFLQDVVNDILLRLADAENIGLERWVTTRLFSYYDSVDDFADGFLGPVLDLSDAVQEARRLRSTPEATDSAKGEASLEVVERTFALFKAAVTSMPVDIERRERAARIVDNVGRGWTNAQQKNYALLIDSAVVLADDLGVKAPLGNRLAEFQPLLEAFTTSKTQEEFNTKLAQFVDAAPSAVEVQHFDRAGLVSLYVGGTIGAVWGHGDVAGEDRSFTGHFAPYVPVGLEVTMKRKLTGLMFSIIDIGNLAAIEFSGGKQTASDASLANVFSPGILYRRAFSDKPFVYGAGLSLVPSGGDDKSRAPRLSLFVAYQMPLYRIFGKKP